MSIFVQIMFYSTFIICFGIILPFLVILARLSGKIRSKQVRKSLNKDDIIKAEYSPLLEMTPAELGFLIDGKIGEKEVVAMRIFEAQGKSLPPRKMDSTQLDMNELFSTFWPTKVFRIFTKRGKVTLQARLLEMQLIRQTNLKNYFEFEKAKNWPSEVAWKFGSYSQIIYAFLFSLFVLVSFVRSNIYLVEGSSSTVQDFVLFVMIFGLLIGLLIGVFFYFYILIAAMVYVRCVGFGMFATEELKEKWREIEGFRWFLEITEFDKIKDQLNKNDTSNEQLAYAVALDTRNSFLKDLKRIS